MKVLDIKLSEQKVKAVKGFLKRAGHHLAYFMLSELKLWFYYRFIYDRQQRYEEIDNNQKKTY